MEWRFKALTKNDTLQNASHLEFFHNEALHSTVDALAREDIQNRLDARAKNEPRVEVRYRLCGPVNPKSREKWFRGLAPHLASEETKQELGTNPSLERSLQWLVIEDYRTTGLEGDPNCFQDPAPNTQRNDFFWFIRNVGRSGKKGGDRGRWGLGKIVYPAASRVRSMFAYTVRGSDGARLLIGRSVLAVHKIDKPQYDSEGYFGRFDDADHKYFAMPETNGTILDEFVKDFRVHRQPDEPGLSVVIPWPEDDITVDSLVKSVIEHWFWVILEDRLIVRVTLDATGEEIMLTGDTIEQIAETYVGQGTAESQSLLRKIAFAREVQSFDPNSPDSHSLQLYPTNTAPKWDDAETRFATPEALEAAREAYRAGRIVAFEVPVRVQRVGLNTEEIACFDVYLKRSEGGEQAVEAFLRDGLTISGQRYSREPGSYAIVKAEDNALGTLLGDAENPAHTKWERGGKHFKGRYENGPSLLAYVQRSAQHLGSLLARKQEGIDRDLLRHLFSIPEDGVEKKLGTKKKSGPNVPPVIITPPEQQTFFIECHKLNGGFRLKPHPKAKAAPYAIQVRAAYEVMRGNPFKLHHPADFDFSAPKELQTEMSGLSIKSADASKLILLVDNPNFDLSITGFDARRDLILDIKPLHADGGALSEKAEVDLPIDQEATP